MIMDKRREEKNKKSHIVLWLFVTAVMVYQLVYFCFRDHWNLDKSGCFRGHVIRAAISWQCFQPGHINNIPGLLF